jgi:hypothetical protein
MGGMEGPIIVVTYVFGWVEHGIENGSLPNLVVFSIVKKLTVRCNGCLTPNGRVHERILGSTSTTITSLLH